MRVFSLAASFSSSMTDTRNAHHLRHLAHSDLTPFSTSSWKKSGDEFQRSRIDPAHFHDHHMEFHNFRDNFITKRAKVLFFFTCLVHSDLYMYNIA